MAKFSNPVSFSAKFGVDADLLQRAGVMDPLLNVDTKLFIDPLLLATSSHREIRENARARLRRHFETVLKLLQLSTERDDAAWRQAERLMNFHEFPATCLGYGAASVHGSGFGDAKRSKVLRTAKEIIDLGVDNPDVFLLIPLLEESIGPDLISDMTTRIILPDLAIFTERILRGTSVPTQSFKFEGETFDLPANPFAKNAMPIVLVPKDVLSRLPVASDWREVADAAAQNAAFRHRVNQYIGDIWQTKTRKNKALLRANVLRSRSAVEALLEVIHGGQRTPYDFNTDPLGLRGWRIVFEKIADDEPLQLARPQSWTLDAVFEIVRKVVSQFQFLIEKKGLNRLLWHQGRPHQEAVAQRLFFAVAHAYCKANDLDITPEADTGNGVVDFKFSEGYSTKVLVETKLSSNHKLMRGFEHQLEAYRTSEETMRAVYLVIDVGGMGKKDKALIELRNEQIRRGESASDLIFVDGFVGPSASNR
jgi:hypothetical protein